MKPLLYLSTSFCNHGLDGEDHARSHSPWSSVAIMIDPRGAVENLINSMAVELSHTAMPFPISSVG